MQYIMIMMLILPKLFYKFKGNDKKFQLLFLEN